MKRLPWIQPDDPPDHFPPVEQAWLDPPGLLAAGGDLSPARLLAGYRRGIFPWYSEGQPILWWSPDPRCVLLPGEFRCSRSLAKRARNGGFSLTIDQAFTRVMRECGAADLRPEGSWIHAQMLSAYTELHRLGYAHSLEVWHDAQLVGGLYGVKLGAMFYGESMFSRKTDASKVALLHLCQQPFSEPIELIDCQMRTDHLLRLGARTWSRTTFLARLAALMPGRDWPPVAK